MSEQFAKLSFEFFPPKDDAGLAKLLGTAKQLAGYGPEFFSVTFGAGGSTQQRTLDTVKAVMEATNVPTAPHISCIGSTKVRILDMLKTYQEAGINRLVALRGDIPSGMVDYGEFAYANELVEFIRTQTGDHFHLSVAGYPEYHPQANSPLDDLSHFMHKCKAGANQAITQYFYNPDAYFYFVDSCRENGVETPIVPGIMPITNYKQLARFSDMCKAEIPRWIRERLAYYDSKDDRVSLREFGEQVITLQCETLLNNGAPGLHFYTLNKADAIDHVLQNLMLSSIQPKLPPEDDNP